MLCAPRFVRFALYLVVCLLAFGCYQSTEAATLPAGFTETQIGGLSSPTAMDIAPDGRIFVCLQGGQLRVIKNGALLPTPFLSLTVDSSGERGLLGVAFDPNFQSNNFIYVYYTVNPSPKHNRVSRFTANGDVVLAGSELPILDLETLSGATNHNGGAIHFGPDGKLYVAVGDNASGANSQTLNTRLGKMLRINSDGSIPSDNPFFDTATGLNRSIWALGLRNPFTFAFQPGSGRMFINDVGQNTWEEINDGIAGSNYGWPNTEGATSDPRFRSPLFSYGHGNSATTGCAIAGGTFYNPGENQFPASYTGKYFFADLCSGWIRVLDPSNNTASGFATGVSSPVDLKVGADGSLYYLAIGSGSVFRVQFTASEPPSDPVVTSHPSDQTVAQGQSATFQITATGAGTLHYQWQRNQENIPGASSTSYTLTNATLADNGAKFRCRVISDLAGTEPTFSTEATLTVTAPPVITTQPSDQTVLQGQSATFQVAATGSPSPTYQWEKNSVPISGETSPTFTLLNATLADNGAKFRVVVSNAFDTLASDEVTLTVNAPPSITTQPSNLSVTVGQPASFTVVAGGTAPLTYQWQRNDAPISGANSPTFNIPVTVLSDNGARFRCVVSNSFGNVTSDETTLTVTDKVPVLFAEPNSDLAIALDSVSMMSGPFPLNTFFNFSSDHRTRLMLFALDADLRPGENVSAITARVEDSLQVIHPVTVEFAGKVPGLDSVTQLVIRLPDGLPSNTDVLVSITLHEQTSNKVRFHIQ